MIRLITALALVVSLCGCAGQTKQISRTRFLLDTFVEITLYGSADEDILDGAFDLCRQYHKMFDRFDPESELAVLNRSDGEREEV